MHYDLWSIYIYIVYVYAFLTPTLVVDDLVNPPARTHQIGGWVGPKASLYDTENWHFLALSGRRL
jgi:hypothetical protein